WTPDGKGVLIRSHRDATNDSDQLYVMPLSGGPPTALPLPMAEQGAFSPDGSHIAYNPIFQWEPDWRDYRGGQTTRIWIARLSDSSIVKLPHANASDRDPMWMGDTVYFLSDRYGPATLYAYAVGSGKLTRLIDNQGFPIDGAAAADGAIVYSQMGVLHLYDVASGRDQRVPVRVDGPLPQTVPHFEKVAKQIQHAGISPTGARAVFEAHGEILTVPADKGDIRDITNTSDAAGRQVDRLFLGRRRRIRAHHPQPGRPGPAAPDQPGPAAVVLLQPGMVAGRQTHCVQRQAAEPLGRRSRSPDAGEGRHRSLRHAVARVRRQLVAGRPLADLYQAAAEPSARGVRVRAGHAPG